MNELSQALGFSNLTNYEAFITNERRIVGELEREYKLSTYGKDKIRDLAMEAINLSNLNHKNTGGISILVENNCERIRRNCLAVVASTAMAAHLACLSIDLTIIGGVLCHGSAIVYQVAASDTCNAEAENCEGKNAE